MAAKTPSCVITDVTGEFDAAAFDKPLGDMLVKCESNAGLFLQTVFGFLQRRSNFFKEGQPKQRVLEAYRAVCGEEPATGGMKTGFFGAPASKPTTGAAKQVLKLDKLDQRRPQMPSLTRSFDAVLQAKPPAEPSTSGSSTRAPDVSAAAAPGCNAAWS